MNQRIVNRYIEVARALKPKLQNGRSFHVTCIFDKSKLLCIGVNDYSKEHRRQKFGIYTATKGNSNYIAGVHSELSAIIKLGEEDCSRFTFLNIRINNNNQPDLSKPCKNCANLLNQVGYKRLFYTTKDSVMEY